MLKRVCTFIFLLVFSFRALYSQEIETKAFPNDDKNVYPIYLGNKTSSELLITITDTIVSQIDYIKLKNDYSNILSKKIDILKQYPNKFVLARITDRTYKVYNTDIVINNPVEYGLYYRKKSIKCYWAGFGCYSAGSIFIAASPFVKDRDIRCVLYGLGSAAYIAGSACMISGIVFSVKKEQYLIIGCSNYGISAQWRFWLAQIINIKRNPNNMIVCLIMVGLYGLMLFLFLMFFIRKNKKK